MTTPTNQDLAKFMEDYLKECGSLNVEDSVDPSTDLVALGVESIQLLTLLTLIEKKFKLSISIESLEKHCFSFSADTILDVVTE